VDVAGEFNLLFMHFDGLDLLALARVQAFVRHESDCHWSVLFPTKWALDSNEFAFMDYFYFDCRFGAAPDD
jgi:hypothetical protein